MFIVASIASLFAVNQAFAQETVDLSAPCGTRYYVTKSDNWFIQLGAGTNTPFVENVHGDTHQFTANYGVGFGKWFSPYLGWRLEFQGGSIHWNNNGVGIGHAKTVNGNLDFMWDMFNSLGGVNSERVFSIVPFVGLGGTFNWDYKNVAVQPELDNENVPNYEEGRKKHNEWMLPVSAGIQLRFRLSKYVDFYAQARASFYSDSFNNYVYADPVDINISTLAGFTYTFGGRDYRSFDPCAYTGYIDQLNGQINDLRGELAATATALAAAEAQLPCPEVVVAEPVVCESAALLPTVRFTINSSKITKMEQVNVYNMAQWMKDNADAKVIITGYADKKTGSANYNQGLSERRAKAVYDMLVKEYGINPNRLQTAAEGSSQQIYDVNNWNRIVTFTVAE